MIRATSIVLLLLLGGCSAVGVPPSEEPTGEPSVVQAAASTSSAAPSVMTEWSEPAAYSFTLESLCGERNLIGRFAVEVRNGVVIAVDGRDDRGEIATSVVAPADVPTLAGLLALVAEARSAGADKVDLVTDPADGKPVRVAIDWQAAAVDDEECYTVSDFLAGE